MSKISLSDFFPYFSVHLLGKDQESKQARELVGLDMYEVVGIKTKLNMDTVVDLMKKYYNVANKTVDCASFLKNLNLALYSQSKALEFFNKLASLVAEIQQKSDIDYLFATGSLPPSFIQSLQSNATHSTNLVEKNREINRPKVLQVNFNLEETSPTHKINATSVKNLEIPVSSLLINPPSPSGLPSAKGSRAFSSKLVIDDIASPSTNSISSHGSRKTSLPTETCLVTPISKSRSKTTPVQTSPVDSSQNLSPPPPLVVPFIAEPSSVPAVISPHATLWSNSNFTFGTSTTPSNLLIATTSSSGVGSFNQNQFNHLAITTSPNSVAASPNIKDDEDRKKKITTPGTDKSDVLYGRRRGRSDSKQDKPKAVQKLFAANVTVLCDKLFSIENERKAAEKTAEQLELTLFNLQKTLQDRQAVLVENEAAVSAMKAQAQNLTQELAKVKANANEATKQASTFNTKLKSLETELNLEENLIKQADNRLESLQNEYEKLWAMLVQKEMEQEENQKRLDEQNALRSKSPTQLRGESRQLFNTALRHHSPVSVLPDFSEISEMPEFSPLNPPVSKSPLPVSRSPFVDDSNDEDEIEREESNLRNPYLRNISSAKPVNLFRMNSTSSAIAEDSNEFDTVEFNKESFKSVFTSQDDDVLGGVVDEDDPWKRSHFIESRPGTSKGLSRPGTSNQRPMTGNKRTDVKLSSVFPDKIPEDTVLHFPYASSSPIIVSSSGGINQQVLYGSKSSVKAKNRYVDDDENSLPSPSKTKLKVSQRALTRLDNSDEMTNFSEYEKVVDLNGSKSQENRTISD